MGDFHEVNSSPELLSQVIEVKPFGYTKDQMLEHFSKEKFFRWSYDDEKMNLTIWPFINEKESPDHRDVDMNAKRKGLTGYYNKQNGLMPYTPGMDKLYQEALKIVLKKYFNS